MTNSPVFSDFAGAVVIGRNEGERLERCLLSLKNNIETIVYVDSASTDNSIELAKTLGVDTLSLDMSKKFTAARARNEGFELLVELNRDVKYVQFVDGDCEIVPGWLDAAIIYMEENDEMGVVCGRRRERYPERTIYNKLCDIEWNTPIGLTKACGGDALYRIEAYNSVDGFRADLIAGEEPELCVRLRNNNWKVWRLDEEMTLHDADIHNIKQWWNRAVRCGHAYAEGVYLHGRSEEKHKVRETIRVAVWGLFLPLLIIFFSYYNLWFLLLLLLYPVQIIKSVRNGVHDTKTNWLYAIFTSLGKFPEAYGQLKFWVNHFLKRQSKIIEYK